MQWADVEFAAGAVLAERSGKGHVRPRWRLHVALCSCVRRHGAATGNPPREAADAALVLYRRSGSDSCAMGKKPRARPETQHQIGNPGSSMPMSRASTRVLVVLERNPWKSTGDATSSCKGCTIQNGAGIASWQSAFPFPTQQRRWP
ncbi:hypothetical protein ANO11243_029430 [Dothideomycetidae sp. 11243]|nr:hypothetical protein ANO11243_029430 [fungal sp. No.11243]